MDFTVKHFSELTNEELYDILRLRVNVFVVEQECPYPEIDGNDSCAYHDFHRGEDGALDVSALFDVLDDLADLSVSGLGRWERVDLDADGRSVLGLHFAGQPERQNWAHALERITGELSAVLPAPAR